MGSTVSDAFRAVATPLETSPSGLLAFAALPSSRPSARRLASRPPEALAELKTILSESEELPLQEALANEQRRFQGIARTPEAMERMAAVQKRYDAGELPTDLYDEPFDP